MVNVDRLLHAEVGDAARDQSKVEVLSRSLRPSATAERSQIIPSDRSVVEPQGFAIALDCDVLFSLRWPAPPASRIEPHRGPQTQLLSCRVVPATVESDVDAFETLGLLSFCLTGVGLTVAMGQVDVVRERGE